MNVKILQGDCIDVMRSLPGLSVNCCVTSPPYYGLRDYGCDGQIGLEGSLQAYIAKMVEVFRQVRRVLRDDGTVWLNLGDSYSSRGGARTMENSIEDNGRNRAREAGATVDDARSGIPGFEPKNLLGVPWRVAFALQADGWYLRQDIIWNKPNPMPESVKDRCTKAHEYIFLLSKSPRYYYDYEAIKEPVGDKGNANGFRGGAYCNGNIDNSSLGKRTSPGNLPVPSGWDVGKGSHGSFHKEGRKNNCEYEGKHSTSDEQSAGRKLLKSMKKAREESGSHENHFGAKRNKRSVWTVATHPYKEAHFATFPPKLIEPCIMAGCPVGGTVLDCFGGSGTTGMVAQNLGRNSILIELNPDYIKIQKQRTAQMGMEL